MVQGLVDDTWICLSSLLENAGGSSQSRIYSPIPGTSFCRLLCVLLVSLPCSLELHGMIKSNLDGLKQFM